MPIIPVPIVIPIKKDIYEGGNCAFIESYEGTYINVRISTECGTYYSQGKWWIWFYVQGKTKYYGMPFESDQLAKEELLKILNQLKE